MAFKWGVILTAYVRPGMILQAMPMPFVECLDARDASVKNCRSRRGLSSEALLIRVSQVSRRLAEGANKGGFIGGGVMFGHGWNRYCLQGPRISSS